MVSGYGSELPSDSSKEINIVRSKTQKTQQEKKKKNRWLRRNSSDTDTGEGFLWFSHRLDGRVCGRRDWLSDRDNSGVWLVKGLNTLR